MTSGIPYDSAEGRAICGALTAIMTGVVLRDLGRDGGRARRLPGLRPQRRARCCASCATTAAPPMAQADGYEKLAVAPVPLDHADLTQTRARRRTPRRPGTAPSSSARSTATATRRSTVIAPTGTIGLVMDCDTTGIEPDFALVKFKKLAGGGYFKIINRAVPEALRTLGYARGADRRDRGLRGRPRHPRRGARHQPRLAHGQGLRRRARSRRSRRRCGSAFDIKFVFNQWTLGEDFCTETLGITDEQLDDSSFDLLPALGFSRKARSRPPTSTSAAR